MALVPDRDNVGSVNASPAKCAGGSQNGSPRPLVFLLFFLSGFCGLVYQLVWTRLAFAAFGIITPVLSVVISVFMLGLSLGAWAGGRWIDSATRRSGISAAVFYATTEFGIGLGAFCVPGLFVQGQRLLERVGEINSLGYLILSGVVLAGSILPWCVLMGATFPLMMAYLRERVDRASENFSYLYFANVLGAALGICVSALVLVEIFGFKDTLRIAAAGNFIIAVLSLRLGSRSFVAGRQAPLKSEAAEVVPESFSCLQSNYSYAKGLLFTTGFVSMAMEVVWTRAFAPILKTQVYSFAMVVAVYLSATFIGSWLYRRGLRRQQAGPVAGVILLLCFAAFAPVLAEEGCFQIPGIGLRFDGPLGIALLLLSICPLCGLLGYLTPRLVDEVAAGSPSETGSAYAINVLGCVLGPLFASYALLAYLSERKSLILLGLPFFAFYVVADTKTWPARRIVSFSSAAGVLMVAILACRDFEDFVFAKDGRPILSRRDYAASVIGVGSGLDKWLLVNGNSMTSLTPITKFMAHLPLAHHRGKPESALVICFGMGTTFRSALSWDVQTTAVELVPSVPKIFNFFFADAAEFLRNPKGRIVIDDGRRFLNRTSEKYDVIIVDPPPPVEAAGSSLLYSREFYRIAIQHLKAGGIIQAWVPENVAVAGAALRSLTDCFPHVRCFGSVQGRGVHMLASGEPIPSFGPADLASRMPAAARADLLEWSGSTNLVGMLDIVLRSEFKPEKLLPPNPNICITDDQPYNEYYLLREKGWW
jgi:predicted membrane-bound spermidine synthase